MKTVIRPQYDMQQPTSHSRGPHVQLHRKNERNTEGAWGDRLERTIQQSIYEELKNTACNSTLIRWGSCLQGGRRAIVDDIHYHNTYVAFIIFVEKL